MFENMFKGIMGKIDRGCARLTYNGRIAIRTEDGKYKTYDLKRHKLTNCDRFVLDIADDAFMVLPTRKLHAGDIILVRHGDNVRPKCIISDKLEEDGSVKAVDYFSSEISFIIPEHHYFMGRQFYGKIVSIFGNVLKSGKGGNIFTSMMRLKLMQTMMGGSGSESNDASGNPFGGMFGGNNMMAMMMLSGGSNPFGEMLDGVLGEDGSDLFKDVNLLGDSAEEDDDDDDDDEPKRKPTKKSKKSGKKKAKVVVEEDDEEESSDEDDGE